MDPLADEGARVTRRPGAGGADGLRVPLEAVLGRGDRRDRPAPSGRLRCQRLVGPVREHLPVDGAGGTGLRPERPQRAGCGGPGSCGDDQAAGPAVPAPVRGLVLDPRWVAGDRPDGGDRAGGDRRRVAAVRGGRRAWRLPAQPGRLPERIFPILSLQAWNIWWILQVATVGGYTGDQVAVLGPITFRHIASSSPVCCRSWSRC